MYIRRMAPFRAYPTYDAAALLHVAELRPGERVQRPALGADCPDRHRSGPTFREKSGYCMAPTKPSSRAANSSSARSTSLRIISPANPN